MAKTGVSISAGRRLHDLTLSVLPQLIGRHSIASRHKEPIVKNVSVALVGVMHFARPFCLLNCSSPLTVISRTLPRPNLFSLALRSTRIAKMSSKSFISYVTSHSEFPYDSCNSAVGTLRSIQQYQAADGEKPKWLKIEDAIDIHALSTSFEASATGQEEIEKAQPLESKLFDFVSSQQQDSYAETHAGNSVRDRVIVAVFITLQDESTEKRAAHDEWYDTEHIPMLSKVPGWLRTRRYVSSTETVRHGPTEYLALHEYLPENGLDGPEFKAATSTPWNAIIKRDCVKEKRRRVWRSCDLNS